MSVKVYGNSRKIEGAHLEAREIDEITFNFNAVFKSKQFENLTKSNYAYLQIAYLGSDAK